MCSCVFVFVRVQCLCVHARRAHVAAARARGCVCVGACICQNVCKGENAWIQTESTVHACVRARERERERIHHGMCECVWMCTHVNCVQCCLDSLPLIPAQVLTPLCHRLPWLHTLTCHLLCPLRGCSGSGVFRLDLCKHFLLGGPQSTLI